MGHSNVGARADNFHKYIQFTQIQVAHKLKPTHFWTGTRGIFLRLGLEDGIGLAGF